MDAETANPMLRATRRIEHASALDGLVSVLRPYADLLVETPLRRDIFRGRWLGHSLHRMLTDLPIGFWTCANVLDLAGPAGSSAAAQRLVGLGVLSAVPTAVAGAADWTAFDAPEDRRTGVTHALGNSVALAAFTASWFARRQGREGLGRALGYLGAAVATGAGYLGGHLAEPH